MTTASLVERMTERNMLDLLATRYTKTDDRRGGAHRYAFADHVPNKPVNARRIADFIAVDCWRGNWADWQDGHDWADERWGYAIHGHEVKVSRADWLAELSKPDKADAFRAYCHYWWLVVSDVSIVRDDELPDGWGLLAPRGSHLAAVVRGPRREPLPMPLPMTVSLMRAIAKTARLSASPEGGESE